MVSDAKSAECFKERGRSAAKNVAEQLNMMRTEKCPLKGQLNTVRAISEEWWRWKPDGHKLRVKGGEQVEKGTF